MKNFSFLNIDIPLLKNGVDIESIPRKNISILDPTQYINEDLIKFLENLNLEILLVETFFKSPNGFLGGIHTDLSGGDLTKLIWVFGGGDSKMVWYKPLFNFSKNLSKTEESTAFISYQPYEVSEIERTAIKNPTLVQVGIPHGISDITQDRICIGIVFLFKDTKKKLTMEEARNVFKDYIT